jgi:hypothetical protein
MAILMTMIYVIGPLVSKLIKKSFPKLMINADNLSGEVNICNYWNSLDKNDKEWVIEEEKNSRLILSKVSPGI